MARTMQYIAWLRNAGFDGEGVRFEGFCRDGHVSDRPDPKTWPPGVPVPDDTDLPTIEQATATLSAPSAADVAHAAKRDYLRRRFGEQLAAEGVSADATAEEIAAALDAAIGDLPVKQQRVLRAVVAMVNLHEMDEHLED